MNTFKGYTKLIGNLLTMTDSAHTFITAYPAWYELFQRVYMKTSSTHLTSLAAHTLLNHSRISRYFAYN